ncbi:hypothetical protein SDJN02_14965, partial [Cucurbita argyrosperma subsp. argyrosperma]
GRHISLFFTVTLKLSSTSLLRRSPLRALSISLPSLRTFRPHTHRDHPGGAARRRKTGLRQLLFCEVCKHHDLRIDLPSIHLRFLKRRKLYSVRYRTLGAKTIFGKDHWVR